MDDRKKDFEFMGQAAGIVAAYAGNNKISSAYLVELIGSVHTALKDVFTALYVPDTKPPKPAVPIKKPVTADYIICLEDGKKYKSLRRHLRTHFGLTPDEYRAKWGLGQIIRWLPRTMPKHVQSLRQIWGWGKSAKGRKRSSSERQSQSRSI